MKICIPVCIAILALSGCASLDDMTSAKKMEAVEIFRGDVDQAKFPAWAECSAPAKPPTKSYGNSAEDSRTNSDSITRAFICAMRAEHDAYSAEIALITADAKKGEPEPVKQSGSDEVRGVNAKNPNADKKPETANTGQREHLLYWQRNLANDAIAVANMNCDYHFRDTEIDRANFEYRQGALNTVASAISAGLAALSTHNRTIFNLATTSTAANSIATQYKSTIFLTPLLRKLHKKLDDPRKEVASGIREALTLDSMPRVMLLKAKLVEYEQLCSRESLIEILSQAIDIPRYEPPSEIPVQNQNEAKQLAAELAKTGKTSTTKLTERYIKTLAVLSTLDGRDKVIKAILGDDSSKELGAIAEALFKSDIFAESTRKLTRIMVLLRYDDDADLGEIKSALLKPLSTAEATKTSAAAAAKDKGTTDATKSAASSKGLQLLSDDTAAIGKMLAPRKVDRSRQVIGKPLNDVRVRIFATQPQ